MQEVKHEVDSCPNCSTVVMSCRFCRMPYNHGYKVGWCSEACYDWNQMFSQEDFQKTRRPKEEIWEVWCRSRYPIDNYDRVPHFFRVI